jgi:hypothetical protein
MDPVTIAASVVVSLAGSGTLAAYINGRTQRSLATQQATLADEAADRAFDRNLRGIRAAEQLARRREQAETVDKILGHAHAMRDAGRQLQWRAGQAAPRVSPSGISAVDTGRLTDTQEGVTVASAYDACKLHFWGSNLGAWVPNRPGVDAAIADLEAAARSWRTREGKGAE